MAWTRRVFLSRLALGIAAGSWAFRALAAALRLTERNPLGPFYREGAPFREHLAEGVKGTPIAVSGKVTDADGKPLAGAIVDLWHADPKGVYDNDGDEFLCRGRVKADAAGAYAFRTVHPGHYTDGAVGRPSHIHYRVTAEGAKELVTQLYFKGDPRNAADGLVKDSLVVEIKDGKGTFDLVLARR